MRAYLSGAPKWRDADHPMWTETRTVLQRLAESEARRILADVEPVGPTLNQRDKRGRPLPEWTYNGAYETPFWAIRTDGFGLAESLAAFLAAPDPAAYLRSKQ